MSFTLNIQFMTIKVEMKFDPSMLVREALHLIHENLHHKDKYDEDDYGLFKAAVEGRKYARWLSSDRSLENYGLQVNVCKA